MKNYRSKNTTQKSGIFDESNILQRVKSRCKENNNQNPHQPDSPHISDLALRGSSEGNSITLIYLSYIGLGASKSYFTNTNNSKVGAIRALTAFDAA